MMFLISLFVVNSLCIPLNSSNTRSASGTAITPAPLSCNLDIQSNVVDYPFPYVIPYNTTQSCNIYGPTCQPGAIRLSGAGSDCKLSLTTLPCSSYLASQSTYLSGFQQPNQPGAIFNRWPLDWQVGFGRSPECRSYEKLHGENQATVPWTFSQCQGKDAVGTRSGNDLLPPQVPPGVLRKEHWDWWSCCGNCSVDVPEVRLYYFQDKSEEALNYCNSVGRGVVGQNGTSNNASISDQKRLKREVSMAQIGSLAVVSGHTLTSPSVYLEVVGTAAAQDRCGPIGAAVTSPFIPFPPGGLSTYVPQIKYSVGQEWNDPQGFIGPIFIGSAAPLKIPELECPTFGVGKATDLDTEGKARTTVGPPWLPLIIPPNEALALDPEWSRLCPGILSYSLGMKSFAIFDPPRALVPGQGMIADPTKPLPAGETPDPPLENPMLQPGQMPKDDRPVPTGLPGGPLVGPQQPQQEGSDRSKPEAEPAKEDPNKDTSDKNDPPLGNDNANEDTADRNTASAGDGDNNDPVTGDDPENSDHQNNDPSQEGNQHVPAQPTPGKPTEGSNGPNQDSKGRPHGNDDANEDPANGDSAPAEDSNGPNKDLKTNFDKPIEDALPAPNLDPPGNPGGAVDHAGGEPSESGNGAGKAGQSVGQAIQNGLGSGQSEDSKDHPSNRATSPESDEHTPVIPQPLTVGDQTFTPDPDGFKIGDTALKAGGPAATIAGTRVSLGTSNTLIIGDKTLDIGSTSAPDRPQPVTVGSQTFTPNPQGFEVAGQAVRPGGPAATLAGTPLSLGASGVLQIGSQTVSLSPSSASGPIFTAGDQTFRANPTGFMLGAGTSISPGGPAVTVSGTRVSLGRGGYLVYATRTVALPTARAGGLVTIAGEAVTANPTGFAVEGAGVGSSVLPGGSAVVVHGTRVSLGSDGVLDVGGSTTALVQETGTASPEAFAGGAGILKPPCRLLLVVIAFWYLT